MSLSSLVVTDTGAGVTHTTATFNPPADKLVFLHVVLRDSNTLSLGTVSDNIVGSTGWNLVAMSPNLFTFSANRTVAVYWQIMPSSPGTGRTVTYTATESIQVAILEVLEYTGSYDAGTPIRQVKTGAVAASTASVTLDSAPESGNLIVGLWGNQATVGGYDSEYTLISDYVTASNDRMHSMQSSSVTDNTLEWTGIQNSYGGSMVAYEVAQPAATVTSDIFIDVVTVNAPDGTPILVGALGNVYNGTVTSNASTITIPSADLPAPGQQFDAVVNLNSGADSRNITIQTQNTTPGAGVTVVDFTVTKVGTNQVNMSLELSQNAAASLQYRIAGSSDPWVTLSPAENSETLYGATIPHNQTRTVPTGNSLEFRATDHVSATYTTSTVTIDYTTAAGWVSVTDAQWIDKRPNDSTQQWSTNWTGQNGFLPDGGATDAWRVSIDYNKSYGTSSWIEFPPNTKEVYVRYRQLLPAHTTSVWNSGGYDIKMPGPVGDVSDVNGGYGGSQSSPYPVDQRAWSARQLLKKPGTSNPYAYGMELYHANATNTGGRGLNQYNQQIMFGDPIYYSASGYFTGALSLTPDQWVEIKVRVKMNTLGSGNGIVQTWMDGAPGTSRTNITFSTRAEMLYARWYWFDIFYGGNPKPEPGTLYMFFRDFAYQVIS